MQNWDINKPLNMLFCLTKVFFPLPLLTFTWLILGLIFSRFTQIPAVRWGTYWLLIAGTHSNCWMSMPHTLMTVLNATPAFSDFFNTQLRRYCLQVHSLAEWCPSSTGSRDPGLAYLSHWTRLSCTYQLFYNHGFMGVFFQFSAVPWGLGQCLHLCF